jgi:hypothetical protein
MTSVPLRPSLRLRLLSPLPSLLPRRRAVITAETVVTSGTINLVVMVITSVVAVVAVVLAVVVDVDVDVDVDLAVMVMVRAVPPAATTIADLALAAMTARSVRVVDSTTGVTRRRLSPPRTPKSPSPRPLSLARRRLPLPLLPKRRRRRITPSPTSSFWPRRPPGPWLLTASRAVR